MSSGQYSGCVMNVVYALTRNYYHKLIPSMTSLVKFNPQARIFILAEDDTVPDLPVQCNVINISSQKYFSPDDINYNNWFTYINLLKVCYPSILPVDKVIHLDVDTIICGSLIPLWETGVDGKWFAACPEYNGTWKPFGPLYYNMGVALINLEQMRADGCERELVTYLKGGKQPWADQDAWNKLALERNKAVAFDLRFNENRMTGFTKNPIIVHYCSHSDWYENKNTPRREYLEPYLSDAVTKE